MSFTAERRLAALNRLYAQCNATPVPPPLASPPAAFPQQVAALKTRIDQITTLMSEQKAGRRVTKHSTRERVQLRKALREQHLLPLEHAARAIERSHPGLTVHFSVPPVNAREALLVSEAQSAATELARPEFSALFAEVAGPDCLDRLNAAIQAVKDAGGENESGRSRRVNATTGVQQALLDGRRIARYILALVRSACMTFAQTDPVSAAQVLRDFETAARVAIPAKSRSTAGVGDGTATSAGGAVSPGTATGTSATPSANDTVSTASPGNTPATGAPLAAAA